VFSDTARVAFECRINTFVASEDDISRLTIIWQGSSDGSSFSDFSNNTVFNPLPGYSVFVMDIIDINTLPVMFRCQAVFRPVTGGDMTIATSSIAYIVNITDILGNCYCS